MSTMLKKILWNLKFKQQASKMSCTIHKHFRTRKESLMAILEVEWPTGQKRHISEKTMIISSLRIEGGLDMKWPICAYK